MGVRLCFSGSEIRAFSLCIPCGKGALNAKGEVAMPELRTKEVEDLLEVFAGLTDPDDVFALLEDLFTVREIKDTSQRLDVARMLRKGSSYAVIEKATGASATTIARVSKALNYGAGGYGLAFDVLDAKEVNAEGLDEAPASEKE
jgi:TrpR-related protein YerC/YecD